MASGRKINCYTEIREEARKYEKYRKNTYGQLNMGSGREIALFAETLNGSVISGM